ncbi:MAG: CotH kinase family protein [Planctomycetota bacterium]
MTRLLPSCSLILVVFLAVPSLRAQEPPPVPAEVLERLRARFDADGDGKLDAAEEAEMQGFLRRRAERRARERGRGGPGGGPGGGPMGREIALVEKFDKDGNGRLDAEERVPAREEARKAAREGPGRFGRRRGPPGSEAEEEESDGGETKRVPGPDPKKVARFPDRPLYDPTVVRTIFLDFPQADWFEELGDFWRSDVELPARLTMDDVVIPEVGVAFRGNTSFMTVAGRKKPFAISVDFADGKARLGGYRTLNLLNAHTDPTYLREFLFSEISRRYTSAPQAGFVELVVNGERLGLYVNVQQNNKDLLEEIWGSGKGYRWKVPVNFGGDGGLRYLGPERAPYEAAYRLKSGKPDQAWPALIAATRVLAETPAEKLAEVLPRHFAIDDILWHLALDNVFQDDDGYFSRASDYQVWIDGDGRLHLLTHDNNETFRPAGMGPGGRGGPGGRRGGPPPFGPPPGGNDLGPDGPPDGPPDAPGSEQDERPERTGRGEPAAPFGRDPLGFASGDARERPLIHRLLEVPAWRARYLHHVRWLVDHELDWSRLGPRVATLRTLIAPHVKDDPWSLEGFAAFERGFDAPAAANDASEGRRARRRGPGGPSVSLKAFAEGRAAFLRAHPALAGAWPEIAAVEAREVDGDEGRRALSVNARLGAKAEGTRVFLHCAPGDRGDFVEIEMFDDGRHGDGVAGDGVFGARTLERKPGKKLRYRVEARRLEPTPRSAFWPDTASPNARLHEFPKS